MTTPQSSTVTAVKSISDKQLNFAVHGYESRSSTSSISSYRRGGEREHVPQRQRDRGA
jgi:hypothetical protein